MLVVYLAGIVTHEYLLAESCQGPCFLSGLIIGLTKTDITMPEMGMVELCAQVRTGVIPRQETITVSAMDIPTRM